MRRNFAVLSLLVWFVVLVTGAVPHRAAAHQVLQASPRPVIIDTDMALDDWIAILYLLQQPAIEVKALTITGTGETHCGAGVPNAQHLLALGGYPDIPVACGRETPLQGSHVFPIEWRNSVDSMLGLPLPASSAPVLEITAVDLIASVLNDTPQPVTLLTLGPLTTIGELLEAQPALIDQVQMIYVMGGAVNVPGNLMGLDDNTVAEWNIYVDPYAANLVFASGAPVTLVPLDATNTVPLTWDFYYSFQHDRQTRSADFVFKALSKNRWFIRSGDYYFWDPLAAAIAVDESLAGIEMQTIHVIEEEGPQSGRTVSDPAGSPLRVATSAAGERFTTQLINVLNGRAPDMPLPLTGAAPEEEQANKQAVIRWYQTVWGQGDMLAAEALASSDYVVHVNTDLENLPGLLEPIRQLRAGLPDMEVSVEIVIAEGDRVAATVMIHGTHTGTIESDALVLAPTGNEITLRINTVAYLVDGQIVEEWIAMDMLDLMLQTGALSAP